MTLTDKCYEQAGSLFWKDKNGQSSVKFQHRHKRRVDTKLSPKHLASRPQAALASQALLICEPAAVTDRKTTTLTNTVKYCKLA